MQESHHLEKFIPHGKGRKVLAEGGVPVRITENPDSVQHRDKITLGVGDMVQLGEIQDPVLKEEEKLYREYCTLLDNNDPAADEAKALYETVRNKRYQFGSTDKNDLYVGKEGTLVYSIEDGKEYAYRLRKAHVWKKDANGNSQPDPVWEEKIAAIRERIKTSERVADIRQVEVLPEYQGKGIAKALLETAIWDIEHRDKQVEFVVGFVAQHNPDHKKMVAAFKKAGFDAFDAGQLEWDDATQWTMVTMVVRENPNFKK